MTWTLGRTVIATLTIVSALSASNAHAEKARVLQLPVLVGTIVDERQNPVAEGHVVLRLDTWNLAPHGSTETAVTFDVRTDREGRFRSGAIEPLPKGWRRTLRVYERPIPAWSASPLPLLQRTPTPEFQVDLSFNIPSGDYDLGTRMLAMPGSAAPLAPLDDDDLESRYQDAKSLGLFGNRHEQETCLLEMAQRGGERWLRLLRSELDRIRSGDDAQRSQLEDEYDVEHLTVLRRAERERDPLTLEIDGPSRFDCGLDNLPAIDCVLRNVDRTESVAVREHLGGTNGQYLGPRFRHVIIEAIDPQGRRLPTILAPISRRAAYGTKILAPGDSHRFRIHLGSFVELPEPGSYRLRVHYHDANEIDRYPTEQGWIVTSSPLFTVRVSGR